jgi:hypothetical protein
MSKKATLNFPLGENLKNRKLASKTLRLVRVLSGNFFSGSSFLVQKD